MAKRRPIVGLALGGGGARAAIHVGVLKAFEDQKIPIDIIAGTSAGALIGGMYAAKRNSGYIEERILEYLESDLFKRTKFNFLTQVNDKGKDDNNVWERFTGFIKKEYLLAMSLTKQSIVSSQIFMENIAFFIDELNIESLEIPFAAVTTDLAGGEEAVLRKGLLRESIYASSAVPGVVPPMLINGRVLFEGGTVNMVPISVVKSMGAEVVIAVDISKPLTREMSITNCLDAVMRANAIMNREINRCKLRLADVLICPPDLHIYWADFTKTKDLIRLGEQEALKHLEAIKERIEISFKEVISLRFKRFFKRVGTNAIDSETEI